jgi:hypothetical protein
MLSVMAEVIRAEQLTKSYGQNRGIVEVDFRRGFWIPGTKRCGQVHDDQAPARPDPAVERTGHALRARLTA